jgi:Mce-associated membrane protein
MEVAVPSLRRRAAATETDHTEESAKTPANAADALTLAEQAEAEAAEAEAVAQAASARAKAIRMRREAQAAAETAAAETAAAETATGETATGETAAAELAGGETAAAELSGVDIDQFENASREASAPAGRRWRLVLKIVAITVGVLGTAALVAASVYMVMQDRKADDAQRLNAEYAAAGRQSVVTLMSLDFNNAQDDVKQIIDNSTGQFKKDFEDQSADFVKVAQDSKVITDVTVNATAVESMSQDSAVVIVAATSRVTNSAGAKQEPRAWRLSVNLQRDGGQVKMSKVEFVP